ncbi:hypothetical protein LJR143_003551 [Pseudoxanthomonas sp. LjRoot143]|uniref:hypothetical protein n=1 Tax=Pseudoxanthomonas sp. LjRoot143 TaxID=3342266 RepID=UPI003ED12E8D
MNISKKVCVLALLVAPFQAHAQQQTVEGAHLFLSKVVEQGATTFELDDGNGWGQVRASKSFCRYYSYDTASGFKAGEYGCGDYKTSTHDVGGYRLTSIMKLTRCASQISTPEVQAKDIEVDSGQKNYWKVSLPYRKPSYGIDWDKVAEVKQDGTSVAVSGIKPAIRFKLASEPLAARVAYAMEFLRLECDATSGTGF